MGLSSFAFFVGGATFLASVFEAAFFASVFDAAFLASVFDAATLTASVFCCAEFPPALTSVFDDDGADLASDFGFDDSLLAVLTSGFACIVFKAAEDSLVGAVGVDSDFVVDARFEAASGLKLGADDFAGAVPALASDFDNVDAAAEGAFVGASFFTSGFLVGFDPESDDTDRGDGFAALVVPVLSDCFPEVFVGSGLVLEEELPITELEAAVLAAKDNSGFDAEEGIEGRPPSGLEASVALGRGADLT